MKKILKFYSDTCSPCKFMGEQLKKLNNVEIQEVNIMDEENESLIDEYKVRTVPTIVVLNEDGNTIGEFKGVTSIEKIEEVLK